MFVIQNILLAVGNVLGALLNLYFWIVVIAAVISWVRPDPFNPIVRALRVLTEPVFYYVRTWMPFNYRSGLDFSPVVVLLAIQLVKQIVVASLIELAARL